MLKLAILSATKLRQAMKVPVLPSYQTVATMTRSIAIVLPVKSELCMLCAMTLELAGGECGLAAEQFNNSFFRDAE